MRRMRLWAAALIAGQAICAIAILVSSAPAKTASHRTSNRKAPSQYVLRHPRREHCKAHYRRRVVTVKKRIHGHRRKVRETLCVRVHPKPAPKPSTTQPTTPIPVVTAPPIFTPSIPEPRPPREKPPRKPKPPREPTTIMPTCTNHFTGAESDAWYTAANWTDGIPGGFPSYACIPSEYPQSVIFNASAETVSEVGGVWAENTEGITLQTGNLMLVNPEQNSRINNVKPGNAVVTLGEGVTLDLTGTTGELDGTTWNGPGILEIPQKAELRTGECAMWKGEKLNKCIDGTPTPGHDGLQVKNFGTMVGAGIALCRNEAAQAATLENEGFIDMKKSGGFGSASDCGEVGSVTNGERGLIEIANDDGAGCNVLVNVGSLLNKGKIRLVSCAEPETGEVHRPELEIGSSLTEAGTIEAAGVVQIQGSYDPIAASNLEISIRQTSPIGSPETNYGTVKVAGDAILSGQLNIETDRVKTRPLSLGQRFTILEAAGSLSGEFTLGNHCISAEPGDGYTVEYNPGSKGTVTVEVAQVPGC